jgi:dTMP kinase
MLLGSNKNEGLLISLDGTDSSGKETQAKNLEQKLLSFSKTVGRFETPDYSIPSGKKLKALFQGVGGSWDDLSWQEKMKLLALNRMAHKDEVLDILKQGGVVIYDRYVPSSIAHMTVDADDREQALKVTSEHEYEDNGMPRENLSIFLDVPPSIAKRLLEDRKSELEDPDEATDGLELQERIYAEYKRMAASDPEHFIRIDCCDEGELLSAEEIAQLVWTAVVAKFPELEKRSDV